MKFMEKAKRFFTLNAANHEGFTLVELIVVIAILAILAGVAVPAYSGYIKKAKLAGDQTLLSAVNTAYAAACMSNNVDVSNVVAVTGQTPQMPLNADKTVNMDEVAPFGEDFKMFFAGNAEQTYRDLLIENDLRNNDFTAWYTALTADITSEVGNTKYISTDLVLSPAE